MSLVQPIYKKLAAMSSLAAFFLGANQVKGQILYQDFDPDLTDYGEDWFGEIEIDMNLDGETDFVIDAWRFDPCMYCAADFGIDITPTGDHLIAASLFESTTCYLGFFLDTIPSQYIVNISPSGTEIPGTLNFEEHPTIIVDFNTDNWSSGWGDGCLISGPSSMGYIPIKLQSGLDSYYGWIRLSTFFDNVTVHEAALQLVPNESITAGALADSVLITPAFDLKANHIAEYGTASDYTLEAQKSLQEAYIEKYKLFIIPAELTGTLTTADLIDQPESHSMQWIPNGDTILLPIPEDQLDYNGTPLVPDSAYCFVILHELIDLTATFLSAYSEEFIFNNVVAAPENLSHTILCDSSLAATLQVHFEPAEEAISIYSYRVYLGKDPSPGGTPPPLPDAVELLALPEIQFSEVLVDGSTIYEITLPTDQLDIAGNPITSDSIYVLFALSVPVSLEQLPDFVHQTDIQIGNTATAVTDIFAIDNGDEGNISDIYYSFTHGIPEDNTDAYRIFLVENGGPEPDIEFMLDPAPGSFTYTPLSGVSGAGWLSSASTTWDGNDVTNDTYYYLIIASIPDDELCTKAAYAVSDLFLYTDTISVPDGMSNDALLEENIFITNEQDAVILHVNNKKESDQLTLKDIQGRMVPFNSITSEFNYRINTSHLPEGMYILSYMNNNITYNFIFYRY
jgi:hypothetical protein